LLAAMRPRGLIAELIRCFVFVASRALHSIFSFVSQTDFGLLEIVRIDSDHF